jgi:superfamily II DNA or RNA helicase
MTHELAPSEMTLGAIVPGARIQVRDALWTIQRVIPNKPGNLIEAKGLTGIVRGKEAIFIDLIEPSLKVVSPTDIELVADASPGFEDTKLFLESAFRTSAPIGPEPLVLGNAAIDELLFQHVPVRRALTQPRVRLLLSDDVGLGKTLEAGLVTAELILRKRADRVLVVTTKATLAQFQKEFWARFSIPLVRLDSVAIQRMRNAIPTNHNPFNQFDKAIISVDTLKDDAQYRTALESSSRWDLVIIDEAHNVAERKSAVGGASLRANLARLLAAQADSLLLLTATPHDGSSRSFASLISMLDRTAITNPDKVTLEEITPFVIRRFRTTPSVVADLKSRTPERKIEAISFWLSAEEDTAYHMIAELDLDMDAEARGKKANGLELFRTTLAKAIFSIPAACSETIRNRLDRMARGQAKGTPADVKRLEALADGVAAITPDHFTKYQHLLKVLKNQGWTGHDQRDRLVIFSERIATLAFLREHLMRDLGLDADAIVSVDGSGVEGDVKAQKVFEDFGQATAKIRCLLASDMASEGLNLHFQSHKLIHFDLPWAILRFKQRNGRIDRYGQDRQPLIWYFIGKSSHPKVRDMWVLEKLVEKDEEARQGIGDPSVFLGTNDVDEQEAIVADAVDRGIGQEAFEAELDARASVSATVGAAEGYASLDQLLASLEDVPAIASNSVTAAVGPPHLYSSTYNFALAMLRRVERGGEPLGLVEAPSDRIIEISIPSDLKARSAFGTAETSRVDERYMPVEAVPANGRLRLTDQKAVVDAAVKRALTTEETWPDVQYLWDVHPILEWLQDQAANLHGRRAAPVCRIGGLPSGAVAVLMHGTVPNLRGAPFVDRWGVVTVTDGAASQVEEVANFLKRTGLSGPLPNRGNADPARARSALPKAVDVFQSEVRRLRNETQKALDDAHGATLDRLSVLEQRHLDEVQKTFFFETLSDSRAVKRKEKRTAEVKGMIAEWWAWFEGTCHLVDDPNPFVNIVAVFEG